MKKFIPTTWLRAGLHPSSFILLLLVLAGTAVFFRYAQKYAFLRYAIPQADKRPENDPTHCTPKSDGQKRVVFVGDSITMGTVSANYVELLAERLDPEQYDLVNAGINSQLAYNILLRLDEVIQCEPDFVFVLIGTNDMNAVALDGNADGYINGQNLPQAPSAAWYRENLMSIVTQLKKEPGAQIILLSLPPLGELPESAAYQLSAEYSEIVKEVAEETAVSYLPLHESMDTYLQQRSGERRGYGENWYDLVLNGIQRRFLYRQSFDAISKRNGYLLLTDSLHLNNTGANMIVDLVFPILEDEE